MRIVVRSCRAATKWWRCLTSYTSLPLPYRTVKQDVSGGCLEGWESHLPREPQGTSSFFHIPPSAKPRAMPIPLPSQVQWRHPQSHQQCPFLRLALVSVYLTHIGKFLPKLSWAEKIAEGMTREGGRRRRKSGRGREEIHRGTWKPHGIMDFFC